MTTHTLQPVGRLKPDVIAVPAKGLIEHEVEDELILYDPRTDGTHVLNGTAAIVWFLVDGERTLAEVESELADLYGLDRSVVALDVNDVLQEFHRVRLTSW